MMTKKLAKKDKTDPTKEKVEGVFEEGDLVLVESLTVTEPKHGINSSMRKMIGGEFIVDKSEMHHTGSCMIVILRDKNEHSWTFAPPDLKLIKDYLSISSEAMPTEPIMFDPNELI